MAAPEPKPEFSRPLRADQVGREPKRRHVEANPAECARLAERLGLAELKRLVADLEIVRRGGGRIDLAGELEADLVQLCVVSLEPLPAHIRESFSVEFIELPEDAESETAESVVALDAGDPPELLRGGFIDLGEAVVQELAVAIDPYPRAPGAVAEWPGKAAEPEAPAPADGLSQPSIRPARSAERPNFAGFSGGRLWLAGPGEFRYKSPPPAGIPPRGVNEANGCSEEKDVEVASQHAAVPSRAQAVGHRRMPELRRAQAPASCLLGLWPL